MSVEYTMRVTHVCDLCPARSETITEGRWSRGGESPPEGWRYAIGPYCDGDDLEDQTTQTLCPACAQRLREFLKLEVRS